MSTSGVVKVKRESQRSVVMEPKQLSELWKIYILPKKLRATERSCSHALGTLRQLTKSLLHPSTTSHVYQTQHIALTMHASLAAY